MTISPCSSGFLFSLPTCLNMYMFICLPTQLSKYSVVLYTIRHQFALEAMFLSIKVFECDCYIIKCVFFARSVQMAMSGTCRLNSVEVGGRSCARERERDDEKVIHSPLIILLVKCLMHIPLSCPFVWLHL